MCVCKPKVTENVVKPGIKAAELPDTRGKRRHRRRVLDGYQYSLMTDHLEDHNAFCYNIRL